MRLDMYLFTCGLCASRSKAQALIAESLVEVDGKTAVKPSLEVGENNIIRIIDNGKTSFVGRGGEKLEHTFSCFDYSAEGKLCVDIGASTGGFTECLLLHGASKVYAIDSGKEQLAQKLRSDDRVVNIEGFNARNLTCDVIDGNKAQVVVMDVSFISQKLLYPAVLNVAESGADVITLVKPQFEVGKSGIGKKGIVKDVKIRNKALEDVIAFAKDMGFEYVAHTESPIKGGDGNVEFLLHLRVK